MFHDAEYTPEQYRYQKTWGHSTYQDALELAISARAGRFGLFHHSQDRSDEQIDAIVADCRSIAAARGVDMEIFALTQETELTL